MTTQDTAVLPKDLEAIRARHAAATRGPWKWFGNTKAHSLYLATVDRGRRFVMQFARWGFNSAQPRFQVELSGCGVMTDAADLVKYEVEYREDIESIKHPDAIFLEHSWQDVDMLLRLLDNQAASLENLMRAVDAKEETKQILYNDVFYLWRRQDALHETLRDLLNALPAEVKKSLPPALVGRCEASMAKARPVAPEVVVVPRAVAERVLAYIETDDHAQAVKMAARVYFDSDVQKLKKSLEVGARAPDLQPEKTP